MGAALLKVGASLAGSAGLVPRSGADPAITTVKIGRVLYVTSATYIAALWYFGWRNERAGAFEFPIPGLYKGDVTRPGGATDAGDPGSVTLDATPGTFAQTDPLTPPTQNLQTPAGRPGIAGGHALLMYLGNMAPKFGLRATENPNFGGVSPVHVPGSYHYKGRAIDFQATEGPTARGLARLSTFAAWIDRNYRAQMTEIIWAGPGPIAVNNGRSVPSSVYANVWAGHRTHVHIAI